MNLWDEIQPWIDKETGLMTAADGGRDNLVLMSAYLVRELLNRGETDAANSMLKRIADFMTTVQVYPGLYRRLPNDAGDNSVDNLIGACFAQTEIALMIHKWWHARWSCFDVNNTDKFALNRNFYGRFLGLHGFIIAASGARPGLFQRLIWSLSVLWSVHTSKGASDPLLLSLQIDVMSPHCPRAAAYWRKHYSLQELYREYFGEHHPLVNSEVG